MSQDIRMCFVGDSFVAGVGDETMLGWAGRLCADIDQTCLNITYYNLGVRRDSTREVLARWSSECALRLPQDCDARVIFSMGVGDVMLLDQSRRLALTESRDNMRKLLESAQSLYRVLLIGPPPVASADHNQRIGELSAVFREEAMEMGVPYIPLFPALIEDQEYIRSATRFDKLHPRAEGYAKIAKIISNSRAWWFHRTRNACAEGEAQDFTA